ncbi:MAG: hypothetical protein Q4F58_03395 [Candidatus Saccharibacteria bacterium]|nr:hypothetical protein [Candidatus Saccharibacteria bacterium]
MEYLEKITKNPYKDLFWNIPSEQKKGVASVIGGNGQNFKTPMKTAEFLAGEFPLKEVKVVLPDVLKPKLPPLGNLVFLKTTDTGSFSEADEIRAAIDNVDFSLIVGDLSKNAITAKIFGKALTASNKPLLLTRDAIDLVTGEGMDKILMRENLTIYGSILQWQKIFKSVLYPKILQPSQSLVQVAEAFHKFTLSYPVQVVAFHDGQMLIAKNGKVAVVPLVQTAYSPLTIWSGELACKILALNLYNPDKFIEATVAAMFK